MKTENFDVGLIRVKMSHKTFYIWFLFFFSLFRPPRRFCPGQRLPLHLYSWCAWEPGTLSINVTAPAACLAVVHWNPGILIYICKPVRFLHAEFVFIS